jgi:phosphatidylserine synthase
VVSLIICLSLLMISTVPYRGLKGLKNSPRMLALVVVLFGACLAIAARYDISTLFVVVGVGHVMSGPLEALITFPRRRRRRLEARQDRPPGDARG